MNAYMLHLLHRGIVASECIHRVTLAADSSSRESTQPNQSRGPVTEPRSQIRGPPEGA
jgi:hypothetical protein